MKHPIRIHTHPATHARLVIRSTAFGLLAGAASLIAISAQAQTKLEDAVRAQPMDAAALEQRRIPTLGCCRCLGGQNKLDLGTIPGNPWLVNGQPAVAVTSPHPAWSTQTGGVQWIAPNVSGTGGVNQQNRYILRFRIANCTIPQTIVFKGQASAADNFLKITLIAPNNAVVGTAQCVSATGHCFNTTNQLNNFAAWSLTQQGVYTLQVDANNISGPTGMFIKAMVEGQCTKESIKPQKIPGS